MKLEEIKERTATGKEFICMNSNEIKNFVVYFNVNSVFKIVYVALFLMTLHLIKIFKLLN